MAIIGNPFHKKTSQSVICYPTTISPQSHLLSSGVQAEQADEAADLQQEINKNSQASKQGECPHCRHVGQRSYRRQSRQFYQHMTDQESMTLVVGIGRILAPKTFFLITIISFFIFFYRALL